jgi:hypothetical protein
MVIVTDNTKHVYLANACMILSFHTKESEEYQLASKNWKGCDAVKKRQIDFPWVA